MLRLVAATFVALATVALTAIALVTPAAAMGDLVVRESKLGVKETIDALAAAVEAKGFKVVARIDHAAAAKAAGMELKPTEVLIFGNPKVGTPLMETSPEIAIDLPLKALAWQATDGKVHFGYIAPEKLKERHQVKGKDDTFKAMAAAMLAFSEVATGHAK